VRGGGFDSQKKKRPQRLFGLGGGRGGPIPREGTPKSRARCIGTETATSISKKEKKENLNKKVVTVVRVLPIGLKNMRKHREWGGTQGKFIPCSPCLKGKIRMSDTIERPFYEESTKKREEKDKKE